MSTYTPRNPNGLYKLLLWIVLFILALIAFSCSAEWHITQAQKKNPLLFAAKTVQVPDSTRIPGDSATASLDAADTLALIERLSQGWLIKEGRYETMIQLLNGKLTAKGKCRDTTIYKTKTVMVPGYNDSLLQAYIETHGYVKAGLKQAKKEGKKAVKTAHKKAKRGTLFYVFTGIGILAVIAFIIWFIRFIKGLIPITTPGE